MAENYEAFPRIPSDAIRLHWFYGYHDMVLSGTLVHHGKFCWYHLCDGAPGVDAPARYTIHELTDAERAEEERWYPLYRSTSRTSRRRSGRSSTSHTASARTIRRARLSVGSKWIEGEQDQFGGGFSTEDSHPS